MSANSGEIVQPGVLSTIKRHVEAIKNNVDGDELRALIARWERKFRRQGEVDTAPLVELHAQLDLYAKDPVNLPNMRIRARLLQQHLTAYIPEPVTATGQTAPRVVESMRPNTNARAQAMTTNANIPAPAFTLDTKAAHEPKLEPALTPRAEPQEKFQTLLQSEQDAWAAIYGTVKDYHRLKQAWMDSLNELARSRAALEEQLAQTHERNLHIEAERLRLMTELEQIHAAHGQTTRPATDTITLHAVFAHRVTTEVERVKRLKRTKRIPRALALVLIGIDRLGEVEARHGVPGREAVLACYVNEILANFRAYDIVARYDDRHFAILFPDTNKEGAARAIDKACKRAAETYVSHDGVSFPLPVFESALILYSPGEDPAMFLARAERALAVKRSEGNDETKPRAPVTAVA